MKVKKFKNMWTMGLIIFGVILVALYLIKLIFPEYVIGVAEYEPIVKFGTYVDTHLWAYYLFNFLVAVFAHYFYCCACCRKRKLTIIQLLFVFIANIILFVVQKHSPMYYTYYNMVFLVLLPAIFCKMDGCTDIKYLYSTATVYSIHTFAQILSLEIRDINTMITATNSATFTILLIDAYIWLLLLYNYFNYKEKKKNG